MGPIDSIFIVSYRIIYPVLEQLFQMSCVQKLKYHCIFLVEKNLWFHSIFKFSSFFPLSNFVTKFKSEGNVHIWFRIDYACFKVNMVTISNTDFKAKFHQHYGTNALVFFKSRIFILNKAKNTLIKYQWKFPLR